MQARSREATSHWPEHHSFAIYLTLDCFSSKGMPGTVVLVMGDGGGRKRLVPRRRSRNVSLLVSGRSGAFRCERADAPRPPASRNTICWLDIQYKYSLYSKSAVLGVLLPIFSEITMYGASECSESAGPSDAPYAALSFRMKIRPMQ